MTTVARVIAGFIAKAETWALLRATNTKAMIKQYFWPSLVVKVV